MTIDENELILLVAIKTVVSQHAREISWKRGQRCQFKARTQFQEPYRIINNKQNKIETHAVCLCNSLKHSHQHLAQLQQVRYRNYLVMRKYIGIFLSEANSQTEIRWAKQQTCATLRRDPVFSGAHDDI